MSMRRVSFPIVTPMFGLALHLLVQLIILLLALCLWLPSLGWSMHSRSPLERLSVRIGDFYDAWKARQ